MLIKETIEYMQPGNGDKALFSSPNKLFSLLLSSYASKTSTMGLSTSNFKFL